MIYGHFGDFWFSCLCLFLAEFVFLLKLCSLAKEGGQQRFGMRVNMEMGCGMKFIGGMWDRSTLVGARFAHFGRLAVGVSKTKT